MQTGLFPDSYPELEVAAVIQRIRDHERRQHVLAARRACRRQKVRRVLKRLSE